MNIGDSPPPPPPSSTSTIPMRTKLQTVELQWEISDIAVKYLLSCIWIGLLARLVGASFLRALTTLWWPIWELDKRSSGYDAQMRRRAIWYFHGHQRIRPSGHASRLLLLYISTTYFALALWFFPFYRHHSEPSMWGITLKQRKCENRLILSTGYLFFLILTTRLNLMQRLKSPLKTRQSIPVYGGFIVILQ